MGANQTLEKLLCLDISLSPRQPAIRNRRNSQSEELRVKLKFTDRPRMMSVYNDDGKPALERGGC